MKRFLLLICFVFLFIIFTINNSVSYRITFAKKRLDLKAFGHSVSASFAKPQDNLTISLHPQERYTTSQYLIPDANLFENIFNLAKAILLNKKTNPTRYKQSINTSVNYIHFNPFRATLRINGKNFERTLEVNIPDSSLEIWENNKKLNAFTIKPPWIKLTLFPWLTSLTLAGILAYFLRIFFPLKNIKPKLNPNYNGFVIFVLGALLIGFIFIRVSKTMPGFGDEMNYLFQAKIFASGKIFVREPKLPEFFKVDWMDIFGSDKKLWNFHPPGNSLILAVGQLLGVKWITIPIIGGLILLVQYLLALKLFNSQVWAVIHVIIVATSHYFLSLASSYMAHAPSLLFISLFYLFLVGFIKENKQKSLVLAAISLGFAFIVRPLSAVLSAAAPLVFLIFSKKSRIVNPRYLLASIFGFSLIASLIYYYTFAVNGSFTLPYLVKGPELGRTLSARLAISWTQKLSSLYRNANEFQHRVHSFGYLINAVFFFLPLIFISKDRKKWWLLAGYSSFFFYLILHSFLHWYGWKWEPRMIYDISFIFFLITSYGLWVSYTRLGNSKLLKFLLIFIGLVSLIYVVAFNLPYRFQTEYKNYNNAPIEVGGAIRKKGIEQAIIFFTNDKHFAPYLPYNNLSFDGNIIYALSQNEDYDYKLITKFPEKDIYYFTDGETLEKKPNFYKKDIFSLAQVLRKNYSDKDIITVIPWLNMANTSLHDILPGKKVDVGEVIKLMKQNKIADNTYVVLLGRSQDLAAVISYFYDNLTFRKTGFATPTTLISIMSRKVNNSDRIPLFKMLCYQGIDWNGKVIKDSLVTSVNISDCLGEDRSIEWTTYFDQNESKKMEFYLESDDDSRIIVDNATILKANQNGRQTTKFNLEKGKHSLTVKFNNGPDGEFLYAGTIDLEGKEKELSIDSTEFNFYLPQELWN